MEALGEPTRCIVSIEQLDGIADAEDKEARVTKPGSAEAQWKRQMMDTGTMSHNEGVGAGKRWAFSAARGRPERVLDGHNRPWQRNVRNNVPARSSADPAH